MCRKHRLLHLQNPAAVTKPGPCLALTPGLSCESSPACTPCPLLVLPTHNVCTQRKKEGRAYPPESGPIPLSHRSVLCKPQHRQLGTPKAQECCMLTHHSHRHALAAYISVHSSNVCQAGWRYTPTMCDTCTSMVAVHPSHM